MVYFVFSNETILGDKKTKWEKWNFTFVWKKMIVSQPRKLVTQSFPFFENKNYTIKVSFTMGIVELPRSSNPTSDPIESDRIRASDEIRLDSWSRNHVGSDGRIPMNFQWYPIMGIVKHFPIIGSDRIMLDYGNPCFFRQKNMSVRIRPQEYSQKTIHGLIDPMRSYEIRWIPTLGSDRLLHQDPIGSDDPSVPLIFRDQDSYEIRWESCEILRFPIRSDWILLVSDRIRHRIHGPGSADRNRKQIEK